MAECLKERCVRIADAGRNYCSRHECGRTGCPDAQTDNVFDLPFCARHKARAANVSAFITPMPKVEVPSA